jgi:hypothetical protein
MAILFLKVYKEWLLESFLTFYIIESLAYFLIISVSIPLGYVFIV